MMISSFWQLRAVQLGVKISITLLFFSLFYSYSPLLLYPLESQRLIFMPIGLAIMMFFFMEEVSESSKKGWKILVWLCLLTAFGVSLQTWIDEIESLYKLSIHFLNLTKSPSESWDLLKQAVLQKSDALWILWGTWGAVTGSLFLTSILSFEFLVFDSLKSSSQRTTKGPWKSGFMEKYKVNQLSQNRQGLPLGHYKGKLLRYKANPEKGWLGGHHAVFAGSRAGKGVSCVIPAILDHEGSVVCLDIKGENFAVTKRYRESLGRRVIVLNPFSVIESSSHTFNPLDYVRRDHLSRDLHVLTDGLVKPEGGINAHFTDLVRDLLSATMDVTLQSTQNPNLCEISHFFSTPHFIGHLEKWSSSPEKYGEAPAKIATAFLAAGDKEQGSILTTLQRNTSWLTSVEMKKHLSGSTFRLAELLDNKIDLFLVVPMDILKQMETYLRLFTNMILGEVIRQDGKRLMKKPILMVLDEFTRLGRLEKFLDIATVAAGCGLEALFVAQDKGQVDAIWGREGSGTLLGSCATVRAFGLGRTDSVTARWVEEQMGFETILTHSKTKSKDKPSESTNEHKNRLLNAAELQELNPNQMLCFIRSQKPLKLDRIHYYKHKTYKQKADPNPLITP